MKEGREEGGKNKRWRLDWENNNNNKSTLFDIYIYIL